MKGLRFSLKLTAKDTALIACFAVLYAVLYSLPVFPVIGLSGAAINAVAVVAPVTGVILGPFLGVLSAILGGAISFFVGRFSSLSLAATSVGVLSAGLLYTGKRDACAFIYFLLLIFFGVYPSVGPVWLYPPLMWFQIVVFLILLSPLYSITFKKMQNFTSNRELFPAFLLISLISTLAGQVAGSLTFEVVFWPVFIQEISAWEGIWRAVTWVYPVERIIIAVCSTIIGGPLFKALKSANLI